MLKYIAKLKDSIEYNKELKDFFKDNAIDVEKHLKKLDLLIIKSKNPIDIKDFSCFEILEEDRSDFST